MNVIYLNNYHPGFDQLKKNQALQDAITFERERIEKWSVGKTRFLIAREWQCYRMIFRGSIKLIRCD